MAEKVNGRLLASRYSAAGVVFMALGLRFMTMGDQVGTVIYGAATGLCLVAALAHYIKP